MYHQILSCRALSVVNHVCERNCLLCEWTFLQPDGRTIVSCTFDMNGIRDTTTKGVVAGGYFKFYIFLTERDVLHGIMDDVHFQVTSTSLEPVNRMRTR